ncbi:MULTISPECIES: LysE family translocator [unclassified Acinetobacter]|uniref:LysE family translocator n=1 Tax=unclassified Acinetobacter TaxID=196816 RepID=UPI00190D1DBC|nr:MULTISPECIES: LysE family translocator [unclassified Acinetobacter]MBK0062715.1 LysE family translocator [Acinetobacter sp. S55]MBK0065708.1 LysE family translocator [Acinetobacter sp. S54]
MLTLSQAIAFALISLAMVLTPGPNMIYLISRSICQGKTAGFISLAGVALGFVFYMLCASLGITALIVAVPYAYDTIRIAGALYLFWLAWKALKPKAAPIFDIKDLSIDSPVKLFVMGFVTNLLNPKIAIMYLSLLPQFIHPHQGSILFQSIQLGMIQIFVSVTVNALIVFSAGTIALFLQRKPLWAQLQRWLMGTVLASLAVRILLEHRR